MFNEQNTDKKLISKEEKSKDGSMVLISIVIALILAIGAGLLVYFKNEARKKHSNPSNTGSVLLYPNSTSYPRQRGTAFINISGLWALSFYLSQSNERGYNVGLNKKRVKSCPPLAGVGVGIANIGISPNNYYLHLHGTKTGPILFGVNHIEPATKKL